MAKRVSFAARALDYVETAPEGEVDQLLGLLNARFKARANKAQPGQVVKKTRRKRQPRARAAAASPTEANAQAEPAT